MNLGGLLALFLVLLVLAAAIWLLVEVVGLALAVIGYVLVGAVVLGLLVWAVTSLTRAA